MKEVEMERVSNLSMMMTCLWYRHKGQHEQQSSSNKLTSRTSASAEETMGAAQRRAAAAAVKRWSFIILEGTGCRVVNCTAICVYGSVVVVMAAHEWFRECFCQGWLTENACPFQK